ncbi:MAG: hypothetical protein B6241_12665 [Spirochaetaceae bacterium 4572_59]|nr:MAG: hypothetical protein B6241_12665 [Spirochaetaceae bacterium 4572_59]
MKRFLAIAIMLFGFSFLSAEDNNPAIQFGVQLSSDSFTGIQLFSHVVDLSVKAQAIQIDGDATTIPVLVFGGHLAYVLNPFADDKTSFSMGVDRYHAESCRGCHLSVLILRPNVKGSSL